MTGAILLGLVTVWTHYFWSIAVVSDNVELDLVTIDLSCFNQSDMKMAVFWGAPSRLNAVDAGLSGTKRLLA